MVRQIAEEHRIVVLIGRAVFSFFYMNEGRPATCPLKARTIINRTSVNLLIGVVGICWTILPLQTKEAIVSFA